MNKYQTITQQLTQFMYSEAHKIGSKLPSIRALSLKFQCSKSTVIQSLNEMEQMHLIYSKDRSGYYSLVQTNYDMNTKDKVIDFQSSTPDVRLFPYKEFQHCMSQAIQLNKNTLFEYGSSHGMDDLLQEIKIHLEKSQIFVKKEDIIITSGTQQSLFILTQIPFETEKETILIEQPSYSLYVKYLEYYDIPIRTIKRTKEGLDMRELEEIFATGDIKFFYTMPYLHNPLGTNLDKKQKDALLRLAHKYKVYIVEDDHLAEFKTNSKELNLYAQDIHNRVIYLRSFSKIIFPGLRIGFCLCPNHLFEKFAHMRTAMTIDSPMLSQAALVIYMRSGMFEYHKKSMIQVYNERTISLLQSLDQYRLQQECLSKPLQTTISISPLISTDRFLKNCKKENILLMDTQDCYISEHKAKGNHELKISITNVEASKIKEGIAKIHRIICNMERY